MLASSSSSRSSNRPGHRDDKTGRAEAALRTVALDHRLLHGARLRLAAQSFDGDDVRAVELEHELDARIDRAINQPASVGGTRPMSTLHAPQSPSLHTILVPISPCTRRR